MQHYHDLPLKSGSSLFSMGDFVRNMLKILYQEEVDADERYLLSERNDRHISMIDVNLTCLYMQKRGISPICAHMCWEKDISLG